MIEIFTQVVQGWRELGAVGLGALAVAFIIGAMVFAPRPPMCVVSGFVFGFIAIPVVLVASTLGSVLAFMLSRYLFRSRFLKMIERRPVWSALVEAIDAEGWRLVGLLRLASLIPGTATNYLLGVTRIGLWPYTVATLVGLLPQIFLFVYIGAAGQITLEGLSESPLRVALIVVGLIFTAWAIFVVTRRTKAALAFDLAQRGPNAAQCPLARTTITRTVQADSVSWPDTERGSLLSPPDDADARRPQ